jgi:hypothetical protein
LNTAKSLLRFPLPVRSEIRVGTYLFPSDVRVMRLVTVRSQLPVWDPFRVCGADRAVLI